ncbi:phage major capsid protein [Bradyrhizobium liaoningense]|uniref:phage major capsid protein n=1 Tax=Bradyrhizobium liaoningense TaxID=43992 RepID=UPI001BA8C1E9|nr:phage major capsid protein [Bradyrhizobium liaoningense]MBR0906960.1 phage major capsid protein [Bradyrhizobium liaoningense]
MNTSSAICLETKADNDFAHVETALARLAETVNTKSAANDNLRSRLDALELKFNRQGLVAANDNNPAGPERKAFDSYLRRGEETKALRVADDTAGGYFVPEYYQAELDRNLVLFSPIRALARVIPTSAPAVVWPNRSSGMTAQWTGETAERSGTSVTFGERRYTVRELSAYVDVSNQMLEDAAMDIGSLLNFEFAESFGKAESAAFVNGASILSPAGFMQDASIGYTASGSPSTIADADGQADGIIDLYHSIKTPYRANAAWGMNSNTLSAVRKLKDKNGDYLASMQGVNNAPATTLLGRPIVELPDMPDVATGSYPIVFGDFSAGYRIFDRISLSIMRDPYTQASSGLTRFWGRRRVAGGVGKAEALRKLKVAVS